MDKVMSTAEAVARYVEDGMSVYLAGFTHLIPFAAGHEIIRQRRRDLVLCRATPDLLYDQMVAAGVARRLVFSYSGNPGVGLLHCIRRAVEAGQVEVDEWTHFELVARLQAGAADLPFWPLRAAATDLSRRRSRPELTCPFTGERVAAVPALKPDVAVIHVQRADRAGHAVLEGLPGETRDAALAARTVIITAEEVVPEGALGVPPEQVVLPGFRVAAVCEEPFGAHPSYAQGRYGRDRAFYLDWDRRSRDPAQVEAWLAEWVFGVQDRRAYVERLGSPRVAELMDEARTPPRLPAPVHRPEPPTEGERMVVAASRLLRNGERVLVGVGQPNLAANLARLTHAPDLVLVYESGVIGARPKVLPLSIGDPALVEGAECVVPMAEFFQHYLQPGWVDVGFIGGAQVDRWGNVNSTVIGPYEAPRVRLSGSGGAADIAHLARRLVVMLPHRPERLPPAVDFITSAGKGGSRWPDGGPWRVVTDLGMMDVEDGELRLVAIFPGVSLDEVRGRTGWPLRVAPHLEQLPLPDEEELAVLRALVASAGKGGAA